MAKRRDARRNLAEATGARFLAWTPGMKRHDLHRLDGADFAAVFSSAAWWDGRSSWLVEEHEALRPIAPVIAVVEAPFAQRLADRLEPTALDTAAAILGLMVERFGPVGEGAVPSLPGVGLVADVGVWAFQAEPGEHSPVIEADRAFVVFRLDSAQKGGIPPLDRIRASVEVRVRLEKQRVAVRGLAEQLAREAPPRAGSLQPYGARPGMSYREEGPFSRLGAPIPDPALIGAAFSVESGSIAGPVDGRDLRVYLLHILARTPADSAEFAKDLPQIREQALRAAQQSRVQAYVTALRARAKITDRRAEVFPTSAQAAAQAQAPVPQY